MYLMYPAHPAYGRVVPDAEFTLREGAKIIGYGKVVKRWTDENAC
jgi:hypothetical protein